MANTETGVPDKVPPEQTPGVYHESKESKAQAAKAAPESEPEPKKTAAKKAPAKKST